MERQRSGKPTDEQRLIILGFMESNLKFARNQLSDTNKVAHLWDQLLLALNSSGGVRKQKKQWQRFWSDWKSAIKTKAAGLKRKLHRTGGAGPADDDELQELSEIEKRLLQIIGPDFQGDRSTKELGIPSSCSQSQPIPAETIPLVPLVADPSPTSSVQLPIGSQSTSQARINKIRAPKRKLGSSGASDENVAKLLKAEEEANKFRERQAIALEQMVAKIN